MCRDTTSTYYYKPVSASDAMSVIRIMARTAQASATLSSSADVNDVMALMISNNTSWQNIVKALGRCVGAGVGVGM